MVKSYRNYLKLSSILKFSSLNYLKSFFSFGASILLARIIGKELYGDYALGLIFFNILSTINQFGSEKTLIRDLIHEEEPKSVLKAATFINIAVSLITLSTVLVWLSFEDISKASAIIIILFSLSGTSLGLSPIAWFDYKGKIHRQALLFALEKLLYLIAVCTILFFSNHGLVALRTSIAFLICRLIFAIQEWRFVFNNFDGVSNKTWFYIKKLLSNNVWIWLAVVGNLLMSQANQLILKSGTSVSQLPDYAIAFQLIMLIRLFQQQLMRLMAPSIANLTKLGFMNLNNNVGSLHNIRKKMHKYYFLVAIATIPLILPLFIAAPILIKVTVGKQYLDATPIFRILLIWISVFGVGLINNQFLIGFNLNRSFLMIKISFGVASLFLASTLIPNYQGKGAALSLLIAHCGSILIQILVVELFINKMLKANVNLSA